MLFGSSGNPAGEKGRENMATHTANAYWHEMKNKAARNIAKRINKDAAPASEEEAKHMLACAMKKGTYEDAADAIGEYAEWAVAYLMLKMHDATVGA